MRGLSGPTEVEDLEPGDYRIRVRNGSDSIEGGSFNLDQDRKSVV